MESGSRNPSNHTNYMVTEHLNNGLQDLGINAMLLEPSNAFCGIKIAFDLVLDNTVTKNGDSLAYSFG